MPAPVDLPPVPPLSPEEEAALAPLPNEVPPTSPLAPDLPEPAVEVPPTEPAAPSEPLLDRPEPGLPADPRTAAYQRQLDQLRTCIGDCEEGFAVRVVGQRRNVIIQPFDRLRLQHHPVAIQANAALHRLPPCLQIEPATLEQAKLLPSPAKQEQTNGSQNKEQANKTTHRDRLDTRMANLIMNG